MVEATAWPVRFLIIAFAALKGSQLYFLFIIYVQSIFEPRRGLTQTELFKHSSRLEA